MIDPIIGGAIIGGVTGLFNSASSRNQSAINQRRQFAHEKEMADWNWNKNLEMWNMQNAYNTPAEQMQRFEDAGLNKNLMYGQGTSGNSNTLPKYQRNSVDYMTKPPLQLPDMSSKYMELKLMNAQTDNVKASTEVKHEEQLLKSIQQLIGYEKLGSAEAKKNIDTVISKYADSVQSQIVQKQKVEIQNAIKHGKVLDKSLDLTDTQIQQNIAKTKVTQSTIDWMKRTGLNPNDSVVAKSLEYLSSQTGLTPAEIITLYGGYQVLKDVVHSIPALTGKKGAWVKGFKEGVENMKK